jgi:hypothetical protein
MKSPLQNARNMDLNESAGQLPQLQGGLSNWFKPMTFIKVARAVAAGVVVESGDLTQSWTSPEGVTIQGQQVNFDGFIIPREKPLLIKEEGDRSWIGSDLYSTIQLVLENRDCVIHLKTQYRVMAVWNMKSLGFMHYFLVEDYQFSGPLELVEGPMTPNGNRTVETDESGNAVIQLT